MLEHIIEGLGEAKPVRAQGLEEEELEMIKELTLLTAKPSLYVANISEDEVSDYSSNEYVKRVEEYAKNEGAGIVVVSARIESEIAELSEEESAAFLEDLGLEESGLTKLIKASYALLGLINYFTAGEMEARAWTIVDGTKAPQAAGKIHSDIEKGFIRAEIVSFDDLQACGSQNAAKEKGIEPFVGITASSDTFYPGQERYDTYSGKVYRDYQGLLKQWQDLNVMNYEMESATFIHHVNALGLRAGYGSRCDCKSYTTRNSK